MSEELPPTISREVRAGLVEALKLDLVGPWAGHALAEEQLPGRTRPSSWYLTGFLIPSGAPEEQRADDDENDDLEVIPESAGLAEESYEERRTAKKAFFPSSMGLSFLVDADTRSLTAVVRWGDYTKTEIPSEKEDTKTEPVWQRHPREAVVAIPLHGDRRPVRHDVPDSDGLRLHVVERRIRSAGNGPLRDGTRSVSIFLVNERIPVEEGVGEPDLAYAFQAEIEVRCDRPFVPRPNPRGANTDDWDERVADLHYADTPEYATGHGVAADWEVVNEECFALRTTWIPTAEVAKTATFDAEGAELEMEVLGHLPNGEAARAALQPLVDKYREWIAERSEENHGATPAQREVAEELLRRAGVAANRIERGIEALARDEQALDAFRVANRAVARALRQRLPDRFRERPPRWRAFQIAFVLLNLPELVDPHDPHRSFADLLFFPTGGGKTEAYLALAAFAMVLRRLRHPEDGGRAGAGVSVIMRYTLRLLTLDQLSRAAGLVCALELEREENPARYGEWRFEIGLWVGKAATPNVMGHVGDNRPGTARYKVQQYKAKPKYSPLPIPLESCPWCREEFSPDSFSLFPDDDHPTELRIVCTNIECDFTRDRPLPIVAVDEPLYRRLPAFLVATLDKFAALPWVGAAGALLGGANRYDGDGFYGAAEPGPGQRLSVPLLPPDLIIQDELHLIAGPLGTMAGLYESAIDSLCEREVGGRTVRPKIVASTATVRQAENQIQALFARGVTQLFPPPGPTRSDSFFARTAQLSRTPGRLYVGVASQGRNAKVLMRRVWLPLMAAAEYAYRGARDERGEENPADPYMTVLGYFNSLRELGGARRILEEEVQNTLRSYGSRRRVGDAQRLFRDRKRFSEILELTSRVPTSQVAEAKRRLETPFSSPSGSVDCAIATNMISVGLDIPRLGLMVVIGQPKASAEYIQATSRVGRDDDRPGLVVTLLNFHKPRDRSHYERFRHYHETFYRSVEAGSVTPFSARALDRGFAGAMVALARHALPELTRPEGVARLDEVRFALSEKLRSAFLTRVRNQPIESEEEREERLRSVQNRIGDLLDSWSHVISEYRKEGTSAQYQKYELSSPKPLLREMLDTGFESEHHQKFRVNRSLRDVEPEVNLFLED